MNLNKQILNKLVFVLGGSAALLICFWYFAHQWEWYTRWGTRWFEVGWLCRITLILISVTLLHVWRRSHHIGLSTWLLSVVPFLVAEVFRVEVAIAVRSFSQTGSSHFLATYAGSYVAYIAIILFWIIAFPFEKIYERSGYRYSVFWRVGLSAVSLIIIGLSARQSSLLVGSRPASSLAAMNALQAQAQSATLAVFAVLIARMFAPATVTLVRATFRGKGSQTIG